VAKAGNIEFHMPEVPTEMYEKFEVVIKGIEGYVGKNPSKRTILLKVL